MIIKLSREYSSGGKGSVVLDLRALESIAKMRATTVAELIAFYRTKFRVTKLKSLPLVE